MPSNLITLIDIANKIGGVQPILVDALTNQNAGTFFRALPMKQIVGWLEKFTRRVGRPSVSFRSLGEGVSTDKGKNAPFQEGIFLLSGASDTDKITADRSPEGSDTAREQNDTAYLEEMGKVLSTNAFYGSNAQDGGFDGLFKRLPSKADTVISAGGSSEASSIYAVKFGPKKFMGLYNTGPGGGIIEANNYGALTEKDEVGKINEIYRTFFNAGVGLAQYHPKAIGRIGKIDSTHKPTMQHMFEMFNKMDGKPDLLVTTWTVLGYLTDQKLSVLQMTPGDRDLDVMIGKLNGVPIIVDSALRDDEDAVAI